MSCWENLANAIIEQAVMDYRNPPNALEWSGYSDDEVEQFFRSRWFGTLTALDGDELLEKLKWMRRADRRKKSREVPVAA